MSATSSPPRYARTRLRLRSTRTRPARSGPADGSETSLTAAPARCRPLWSGWLGDFVQVVVVEEEGGARQPTVDLVRVAGADDGPGDRRPCQCPGHGHRGRGDAVAVGDGTQGVGEGQVGGQSVTLEVGIAPAPVVVRQRLDPRPR